MNIQLKVFILLLLTVTDNRGGFATDTILVRVDVAQNRGGDLDRRIDENTAHKEIHDLASRSSKRLEW